VAFLPDALWFAQEEVAVAGDGFRILVDGNNNRLDMLVAVPFAAGFTADLLQRLYPGRVFGAVIEILRGLASHLRLPILCAVAAVAA
jgi:hypothetical protein